MKKLLIILILVLITITGVSAASPLLNIFFGYAGGLVEIATEGKTVVALNNKLEAMDIASMTKQERLDTYNDLKQKSFGPTMMNLGLGFGSGSKKVGDILGYTVGTFGDFVGIGVLGVGVSIFVVEWTLRGLFTLWQVKESVIPWEVYQTFGIIGGVALAVTHVIQAIFPPIHVARYNAKLRKSLGLTKAEIKMAVLPNENLGLTAVASIQF